jgi:diguanylate cyclase (GGDEF)-like protein
MQLDIVTLAIVLVFTAALTGLLLTLSWRQNPESTALGWWGLSYLLGALGTLLIFARGRIPDLVSIELANAVLAAALGLGWNAMRLFDRRRLLPLPGMAGAVIWLSACQFDAFYASFPARVALSSAVIGTYTILCAVEIWRGRAEPLMSRRAAVAFLTLHAAAVLARVPFSHLLPFSGGLPGPHANAAALVLFEALFHAIGLAFTLIMMAKERTELGYRHAALIDPLTGVMNRGAFIREGERLLARARAAGEPVAALVFDLDHFKQINDTYGHRGGDLALIAFCRDATANLRPDDLFGRIGGEEFACLLPHISLSAAAQVAERIRATFERVRIDADNGPIAATVSIGAAIAVGGRPDGLGTLLACADGALYRAKARGRNVVEWDRPALAPAGRVSDLGGRRAGFAGRTTALATER